MSYHDIDIMEMAKRELEEEQHREAVERYKDKLRNKKSIWDRIFPFKIVIIRKET